MKAILICPGERPAVPQLAEFGSLASIPALGDAIASHWVEHLAALGATKVDIVAPSRADSVRAAVGDGARWGIRVRVFATRLELTRDEAAKLCHEPGETAWLPAPNDIVPLTHLPGCPDMPLFESYASWFAAIAAWMPRALTPTRVRMAQAGPGLWIGSRARISETATVTAPCWIGDQAIIRGGATVGPNAIIDDRSVVDEGARVTQSWVGPDTFIGPMTAVSNSIAWGGTLTNLQTESSLRVPDPFLMSSLARMPAPLLPERAYPRTEGLGFFASLRARLTRVAPKPARLGGG